MRTRLQNRTQKNLADHSSMSVRVSLDDLYRRSSQYRLWSYTVEELAQKRQEVNEKGRRKTLERIQQNPDVDPELIEIVSMEEEQQIVAFNARRVKQLARLYNIPSQVRATAVSFLRKFYLVNSVMEYHPKLILLTCLFLAAKSENYFIGINSFVKRLPKTTPESILSLEFDILQSLQFTLLTHHPFRPLYGFFFDIQDVLQDQYTAKELGTYYDQARNLIDETLVSDAVYHFTPPQIALACFKEVNSELLEKYLEKKFETANSNEKSNEVKQEESDAHIKEEVQDQKQIPKESTVYTELLHIIEQCQELIKKAHNPSKEEATILDRKTHICLNPAILLKRKRSDTVGSVSNEPNKRARLESSELNSSEPTPTPDA